MIGEVEQLCATSQILRPRICDNINPAAIEETRLICTELHELPNHFTDMLAYMEEGGIRLSVLLIQEFFQLSKLLVFMPNSVTTVT